MDVPYVTFKIVKIQQTTQFYLQFSDNEIGKFWKWIICKILTFCRIFQIKNRISKQLLHLSFKFDNIQISWQIYMNISTFMSVRPSSVRPFVRVQLSYLYYIIRQDKAELRVLKLNSEMHQLPELVPSSCVR